MSVELNETIEIVNRLANMYIEKMYLKVLTLNMYALHTHNLQFMVSEVGRNPVYLNTNPFYEWLLEQPRSEERTVALAFMWRHSFLKKLDNLNIICSTIINKPITVTFCHHMMIRQSLEYNQSSSSWISYYIKNNTPYICDYIDAGNAFLK